MSIEKLVDMNSWLQSIELEGNLVKLLPMLPSHKSGLVKAAEDGNLWELWYTSVPSKETVDDYVDFAFNEQETGLALPFVIIDKKNKYKIRVFCQGSSPPTPHPIRDFQNPLGLRGIWAKIPSQKPESPIHIFYIAKNGHFEGICECISPRGFVK